MASNTIKVSLSVSVNRFRFQSLHTLPFAIRPREVGINLLEGPELESLIDVDDQAVVPLGLLAR